MSRLYSRTYVPDNVAEPQHTAIVIHGLGSNEMDLLGLGRNFDLPIRFVAPRAPLSSGFGFGFSWYNFAERAEPDAESFTDSLASLTAFVADVRAEYDVEPEQLTLIGFSQGAVMSIATALSLRDDIGAVVAMSGYFPQPAGWEPMHADLRQLPVLVTHGDEDDIVPVELGRNAAQLLREHGADVQYEQFSMAHEVNPACMATVRRWLQNRLA